MLIPAATLAGLLLTPAARASLALEELRLDGLRVTFDSAGGFLEPVPMSEATVLADVGRSIDSAIVVLESGDRFVLPGGPQLTLRRAPNAGPEATLQLSATEIPPDSALELQTEDDGTRRLFLPGGDPRALTLGGPWYVDTTLVDFGAIGISRIVIDTRDPIQVDFRVDESRAARALILEDVGIDGLFLSRFRPGLNDRAETTVRGGRVVSDWIEEPLDASSSPSFDSFEGTIDSLWIEDGALRAEIRGSEVTGLSLEGRERMPGLLQTLPDGQRRGLLGILLGLAALGGVWLAAPVLGLGSRPGRPPPAEGHAAAGAARPSRRLAAIWFADIVGFTELSARDEDGALEVSKELERLTRQAVDTHGGRIVKLLGDGVLTEFGSANAAVRAALRLRAGFSASDVVRAKARALRIGVHLCEVVAAPDGDLLGSGVNLASRIESAAAPGKVAVSEDVAHQLRQRGEFRLTPMPPIELKGVQGLAQLFVVETADS
jgi:class 3 adenylate cyclase